MNNKERDWIYRLSMIVRPLQVKNPADIQAKMEYYNESIILAKALREALYIIHDPHEDNDDKEKAVKEVEKIYKEQKRSAQMNP